MWSEKLKIMPRFWAVRMVPSAATGKCGHRVGLRGKIELERFNRPFVMQDWTQMERVGLDTQIWESSTRRSWVNPSFKPLALWLELGPLPLSHTASHNGREMESAFEEECELVISQNIAWLLFIFQINQPSRAFCVPGPQQGTLGRWWKSL